MGVSSSRNRSHSAPRPSGSAKRNGSRHPHDSSSPADRTDASRAATPAPPSSPSATVNDCHDPYNPRLPGGANSVITDTAPELPSRGQTLEHPRKVSSQGARAATVLYVGSAPLVVRWLASG